MVGGGGECKGREDTDWRRGMSCGKKAERIGGGSEGGH